MNLERQTDTGTLLKTVPAPTFKSFAALSDPQQTRRTVLAGAAAVLSGVIATTLRPTRAAAQTEFVDTSSDQSIGGLKTFTVAPAVPADSFPKAAVLGLEYDLAGKQPLIPLGTYADVPTTGTPATAVVTTGDQTIDGAKQFVDKLLVGAPDVNNLAERVFIKGSDPTREVLVLDTPANQTTDPFTVRVGGVVKFDVTNLGGIECFTVSFQHGVGGGIGGGNGVISEPAGGSMRFSCGNLSNGNMVFNCLPNGTHHFQYGGLTKRYSDSSGFTFVNGQTLRWEDAQHAPRAVLRGVTDGSTALAALGNNGITFWAKDFGLLVAKVDTFGRNLGLNTTVFGGGKGVIGIRNADAAPTSNLLGGGVLYVWDGALTFRGANGTITVLAPA